MSLRDGESGESAALTDEDGVMRLHQQAAAAAAAPVPLLRRPATPPLTPMRTLIQT